ncbi:MAG: NUDIX hydrolase [Candidatus Gribaldobacteria bacterium]|nr:NUDIX hydrolase [Candidatus Gribaldobacteria bacterium]
MQNDKGSGLDNRKIGVVQKVIIVNVENKILTMRRSATAPNRSLLWDLPGGELEFGEEALNSILREIKEEVNLEVEDVKVFDVFSGINRKEEFWITICYVAKAKTNEVVLSFEHDQYQWLTCDEFLKLESDLKYIQFITKFKQEYYD